MPAPYLSAPMTRVLRQPLLWLLPLIPWRGGSLMAEDEGYYGLQARWMLQTGDWLTLHWWNELRFDRAIGVQWLQAIAMAVGGETTLMVRLPSIVAFVMVVYLTIAIAKHLHLSAHSARMSGALVALTPLVTNYAHLGTQDLPLVAVELLGIWALLKASHHSHWLVLTGACVGLGFLLKSFMIALPMLALVPYLWQQRLRPLRSAWLYIGLILGAVPVLLWLGLAMHQHGALVWQQLFGKLLYLGESNVHATGWWYYLWNLPLNGFPWVILAVCAKPKPTQQPLLWGYPLVLLLLLSLFSTRTAYYGLQLLPFTAILAAIAMAEGRSKTIEQPPRLVRLAASILGGLSITAAVGLIFVGDLRSYSPLLLLLGLPWLASWRLPEPAHLACWLLGPWLALSFASQSLLWGDYSRDLQQILQTPTVATLLETTTVNISAPPEQTSAVHQALILLGFYTPNLGERYTTLAPGISWLSPDLPRQGDVIATWRDWALVRQSPPPD